MAKRIQNFWGDSLINHPWLQNLIGDDDVEVFGYLKELHVDEEKEKKRTIRFKFGENPYFKNEELTKLGWAFCHFGKTHFFDSF